MSESTRPSTVLRQVLSMLAMLATVASASADDKRLLQIAPAGAYSLRLAAQSNEDDPLTLAARRAADEPSPDASTLELIESVRRRDQGQWEQAFSMDMAQAFRQNADTVSVTFEYPPNPMRPDGFSIAQQLANVVLRANLPCKSIYPVDALGGRLYGWILICDHKARGYGIALVGKDWKLRAVTTRTTEKSVRKAK